jgi:Cellulase (glycosyl hydrolase family 5)
MKHSANFLLALAIALYGSNCYSSDTAIRAVTASTAQLILKEQPDCNVHNSRYFEYADSSVSLKTGKGFTTDELQFGPDTEGCQTHSNRREFNVTGLKPDTTYYYRQCGRIENASESRCGAIGQFTTRERIAAMQRITARDGDLFRNGVRFRVLGVQNLDHDFERGFYTKGSTMDRAKMSNGIKAARTLGANVMRIHLQLFDFIERDASGELIVRQQSFDNLVFLLTIAEQEGLYLLLSGNNVWRPEEVPSWYDDMPYRDRWEVQAFFFEHLAAACAVSPVILAYELMSEPVIELPGDAKWYAGELGGYWFVQAIATNVPRGQQKKVARDWIKRLTSVIREHDAKGLITFGALGSFYDGALGVENTAPLLDIVSPHIYPELDDPANAIAEAQRFATAGKPVVVGETHLYNSNVETYRAFLVRSAPYVDGFISFFNGTGPEDMDDEVEDQEALLLYVHKANLQAIQSLRDVILDR